MTTNTSTTARVIEDRFYSVAQTAVIFGIGESAVRHLAKTGALRRAMCFPWRVMFLGRELKRFLREAAEEHNDQVRGESASAGAGTPAEAVPNR